MYIVDQNDVLPPHIVGPNGALPGSWVVGNAQTDATVSNIQSGVLYRYIGSTAVYRCPADKSTLRGKPASPHTRSYSSDAWLNDDPSPLGVNLQDLKPYMKTKHAQLSNSAEIFTFIDENEQSIDNASLLVSKLVYGTTSTDGPQYINDWDDMPSDRHNQGCSISFADGHVVRWHWKFPKKFQKHVQPAASVTQDPQQNDLKDLRQLQAWTPLE